MLENAPQLSQNDLSRLILNKEYNTVYDELCEVAQKLKLISFNSKLFNP